MKIKNKGKVYPSLSLPSSSSSSPPVAFDYVPDGDFLSVLKLLPAAILALASALSLEDREVLAYLVTRSMKSAAPSSTIPDSKKKSSKRVNGGGCGNGSAHKPPMFDCECFDCYRSYWFRWDSSVNRELIHQAIEAFEDQLTNGEKTKKSSGKSKRRDRTVRREPEKPKINQNQGNLESDESTGVPAPSGESIGSSSSLTTENVEGVEPWDADEKEEVMESVEEVTEKLPEEEDDVPDIVQTWSPSPTNKGNARKVLPDMLGLLNSRLWSLWSPHV